MPSQPDCIIKLGTNLTLVAKYWRKTGWTCPHPPMQEHLNWLMDNIELDGSRYYPDPTNTKIEILVKRMAARVIKPLVYVKVKDKSAIY